MKGFDLDQLDRQIIHALIIDGRVPFSRIAAVVALAPHVKVEDITVRNIAEAKRAYTDTDLRQRMAEDAAKAFKEAKRRGLDPRIIHPADLPTFRLLEAGQSAG